MNHLAEHSGEKWIRMGAPQMWMLVFTTCLAFWLRNRGMPWEPVYGRDTFGYESFSDIRPHGYSLFLWIYRTATGSLTGLPTVQTLVYLGCLHSLGVAVGKRTNNVLLGMAVILVSNCLIPTDLLATVYSDALYGAFLAAGAAFFISFTKFGSAIPLAACATCIGYASITRTIGFIPLAVLALCAGLQLLHAKAAERIRGALAFTLPVIVIIGVGLASNFIFHGTIRIGSWSGMGLLEKGLLVATTSNDPAPLANEVARIVKPAREAVAAIKDPVLKQLVVQQYYECLRWGYVFPYLTGRWDAWQLSSEYGRGKLAGKLAFDYVRANPSGYARRVVEDYLSLWCLPKQLTRNETDRLRKAEEREGPFPLLGECQKKFPGAYFWIVPPPSGPFRVGLTRMVDAVFVLISVLLFLGLVVGKYKAGVFQRNLDVLFLFLTVHASYVGTVMVEMALPRYAVPTWPLMIAFLGIMVGRVKWWQTALVGPYFGLSNLFPKRKARPAESHHQTVPGARPKGTRAIC